MSGEPGGGFRLAFGWARVSVEGRKAVTVSVAEHSSMFRAVAVISQLRIEQGDAQYDVSAIYA